MIMKKIYNQVIVTKVDRIVPITMCNPKSPLDRHEIPVIKPIKGNPKDTMITRTRNSIEVVL